MCLAVCDLELHSRTVSSFIVNVVPLALLLYARQLQKVTFRLVWVLLLLVHAKLELMEAMENELVLEDFVDENLVLIFFDNLHAFVNIVLKSQLNRGTAFEINHQK